MTRTVADHVEPMKGVTRQEEIHLSAEALVGFLLDVITDLELLGIKTAALHAHISLAHLRLHINAMNGLAGTEPDI